MLLEQDRENLYDMLYSKYIISLIHSNIFSMTADTVFSLILGPDMHRDLRGEFCLRQYSNPLKYNICRQFYEG
jgi:hypothetical protein